MLSLGLGLWNSTAVVSGGGGGGSGATWNPADKSADFALTAGNLTASRASGTGDALIRATVGKTAAGSFTVTVTNVGTNVSEVGVSNAAVSTATFLGDAGTCSYFSDGRLFFNGSPVQTGLATYTSGDVITVTWDGTNVSFQKNGASVGTAINVSSVITTAYPAAGTNGTGNVFTLNASGW